MLIFVEGKNRELGYLCCSPAVEVAVVALAILSLKDAAPTKLSVITAEVIGLMTGGPEIHPSHVVTRLEWHGRRTKHNWHQAWETHMIN